MFELCSWFFEHWGQDSKLSRTRPFLPDAVYASGLSVSHGYLSMAVFILIYRSHCYRWAAVVPRSNWQSWALSRKTHTFRKCEALHIRIPSRTSCCFPCERVKKQKQKKTAITQECWEQAIWSKSRRQHPTRHQLYGHLPPITKTIQVRRTRHAGHCWRSKDELISDVLLWTPIYGQAKAGRLARTYIQQLCEDTGCNPEGLPEAINNREKWGERVRDTHAGGTTWWWWWWYYPVLIC